MVTVTRTDKHIHVNAGYGATLTADQADQLGQQLHDLANHIRRDAARAVCHAEGHQQWTANCHIGDQPVTLICCRRPHCAHVQTIPGHTSQPSPPSDLDGMLLLHLHAAGITQLTGQM